MAADTGAFRTSVLYCSQSTAASTWYRAYVPGVELRRRGYDVMLVENATAHDVDTHDVFAIGFWVSPSTWQLVGYAKSQGKHCVLDLDDDLWALHPENPAYAAYSRPESGDYVRAVVRAVDTVTVTTDYLADLIRPLNPDVRVVRNMLPAEHWPAIAKDISRPDPLVIGWAGSSSHVADLRMLAGVIETVLDAYPGVRFALPDSIASPFGAHERIDTLRPTTIEQYAGLVGRFDIGLAPLVDTRFNRAKSDLKWIEYGMCGIPTVASKVVPYETSIRHGEDGLLATSPKDWIKCIRRLVEDDELRVRMGAAARARAEKRTIDLHAGKWVSALGLE